uniref:Neurotransmitter-gated ion-channel ligand-binding domain-containing protein n=1 Tax=Romanomermis culicivorax TaxID=13658 RepID=A0A915ITC7_ROMCU
MIAKIGITLILGLFAQAANSADLDPYFRSIYIGTGETSRIIRKIFQNYDPYSRPKPADGGPTKVTIWIHVIDMMWREDGLYVKGAYKRRWIDERLKFEVKPGGREYIYLDANEFENHIWQPETFLVTHYRHDRWNKGLIRIFSNGTVDDKHLGTTVIHVPESIKNQKSADTTFIVTDFLYDKLGMDMNWYSNGCLIIHNEGMVKLENLKCFKTLTTINNRDYEHLNGNFTFTRP